MAKRKASKGGDPAASAAAATALAAAQPEPHANGGRLATGGAPPRNKKARPAAAKASNVQAGVPAPPTPGAAAPAAGPHAPGATVAVPPHAPDGVPGFKNKERVLIVSTRGVTHCFRHLMLDLFQLLPHAKKDAKLDVKSRRGVVNDVADARGCSTVLLFEARKHKDLYLWLAKAPEGPSFKFLVQNVHTMAELKLAGNHLRGSRPVLSFHAAFDAEPHLVLLKELLTQAFATPRRHPKSKPFTDHVLSFSVADGRVWVRNYQIVPPPNAKKPTPDGVSLVEVGPRFTLTPVTVLAGSFGGRVLWDNADYVSPNAVRAAAKARDAARYGARVGAQARRREHLAAHPMPRDELADVFK